MLIVLIIVLAKIIACVLFASIFEWTLHRFVMHKPVGKFDYPFKAHALVHHQVFKSDHTYHLVHEEDKWTIPMTWWNGPVLILLGTTLTVPISWLLGMWSLTLIALVVFSAYYAAYESLHWCMHLPKKRRVEKFAIFRRINGHHLLHHRYMHKNFNVVLPLADLLFGTLLLRAKTHFKQARGPAVPNVQPL